MVKLEKSNRLFNLFVPAYPLDGGRCLAAGLILCGLSVLNAAITTAVVGMAIAAIMVGWGLLDFFSGAPSGLFTALIGVWIFMTSYGLFKLTRPVGATDSNAIAATATDNLKSHPVFGQQCYQNRARGELATQNNTNTNV